MVVRSLLSTVLTIVLFLRFALESNALIVQDGSKESLRDLLKEHKLVLTAFTSFTVESLEAFHSNLKIASDAVETPVLTVDCELQAELCQEHDVTGYPTLRLFKGENETFRYRDRKISSSIISFVKKHELPTISEMQAAELADFKHVDSIVIVAYLPASESSLQTAFRSVASRHHHSFVFGLTTDQAAAQAEGITMPAIACYKNLDGDNRIISGSFGEEEVEKFLEIATKPVIGEVTERTIDSYLRPGNRLTAYVFLPSSATSPPSPLHYTLLRALTPVAKKYENYVKLGIADAIEYGPMAHGFGLKEGVWPAFVLSMGVRNQVFLFKQGKKITGDAVERMLLEVLEGRMKSGEVWGEDEEDEVESEVVPDRERDEL